jgi:acylglycerol lipase
MRSDGEGARRVTWHRLVRLMAMLAPILTTLLLAACAPPADPTIRFSSSPPSQISASVGATPQLTADAYIAADGARLPLRYWLPDGPVNAVVLGLHGFGDYSHGLDIPARQWATHGIATYAYDQRGFGAAPGHGLWPGEGKLVADAILATRLLRQRYPGRPLYLLGESMGGAVAVLAAAGAPASIIDDTAGPKPVADIDGLILSAPAVWGRATMDFWPKAVLFVGVRLVPDMVVTGRGLRILASDNIPMLRELGRDPLVLKGSRVDMVYGLVNLMDDALAAAPRLPTPTLLLYGAHDQLVPRRPIEEFVGHLPSGEGRRPTLAYYPQGYHLLLRDLEGATVATDVATWMLDRGGALPSHADLAETMRPWPPLNPPHAVALAIPLAEVDPRR